MLVKMHFRLDVQDGYPPVADECIWVRQSGAGYVLHNIPYYVPMVSYLDEVEGCIENGVLHFARVVRRAGHTTLRVVLNEVGMRGRLILTLKGFGCSVEGSNTPHLLAVDVPPECALAPVTEYLEVEERADRIGYEEACIQHQQ